MAKKKPAPRKSTRPTSDAGVEPSSAATPAATGPALPGAEKRPLQTELQQEGDRWSIHVRPLFQRNPEAPLFYAPFVDVRNTPHGIHLLLFLPPAADPEEVVERDGEHRLPVSSSAEVILPPEAVEPLIIGLAQQYRAFLTRRVQEGAAQAGLDMPVNLQLDWVDQILGMQQTEEVQ